MSRENVLHKTSSKESLLPLLESKKIFDNDEETPLLSERRGDVISANRALLTLAKGFVGAGILSLPFAWKEGGLWVSFGLQLFISVLNSYSFYILTKSSQYLAAKTHRSSLDYGHFAKKVFDHSGFTTLKQHSKKGMYIVNVTLLFYQLGIASVPIVFVATNLNKVLKENFDFTTSNRVYATILLLPLIAVNMIGRIRVLSYLAITATLLWLFGAIAMLQQCMRMPSQWDTVPSYTTFWSTILFFGTAIYSYKGQTMILPIENKLRYPEEFMYNFGVLPTLMCLVTLFYLALGFFGYTAYGENTLGTLPLNMPNTNLFKVVSIALIIMGFLAQPVDLFVVFDMFWLGFKRKFTNRFPYWTERPQLLSVLFRTFWVLTTYLIVIIIPKIEQIVSLVGITCGSLCAFIYSPVLETLTFWQLWKTRKTRQFITIKLFVNCFLVLVGIFSFSVGLYVNVVEIYNNF